MNPIGQICGVDVGQPSVMTIVNVTPDSFYSEGRTFDEEAIRVHVSQAIADGCSFIDIGGYSSRPGAEDVPVAEELRRVMLGLRCTREISRDIPVSIDTFRSQVAMAAISADNHIIINDISAGELDPQMIEAVSEADVPYIAMNMRGTPATMSAMTDYDDITEYVTGYFNMKIDTLLDAGIKEHNILLDPGFGFAKNIEQNYELLGHMHKICSLGFPVVAGISRKSMIYNVLGTTPRESLYGTTALHWELLRQGVSVLRVHDTRAAADTIKVYNKFKSLNDK